MDAPMPRGKPVNMVCYVDSDCAADPKMRRSVSGYIIMVNSAPIIWHSKRQRTIKALTYGAVFVAMRTATEEIIGLRYMLRMMGVPVKGPCIVFGDSLLVVSNVTQPESTLKKKHLGIAYHFVQEAAAAKIIKVYHIDTHNNPANPLTKLCSNAELKIIEEMFFDRAKK